MSPIVIFGGTFDPIGANHISAIRRLLKVFRTVVIAAGDKNPFKDWAPTLLVDRLEMIRLAIEAEGFQIAKSPLEPGVYIARTLYWYAHQFIDQWRSDYPDLPVVWAVGEDIAHEVTSWKNWKEMNDISPVAIHTLVRDPAEGSSTEVRQGTIPPLRAIQGYINEHGLYKT